MDLDYQMKNHYRMCRYCGSLEPVSNAGGRKGVVSALFVSADRRIPKIRIQTRQLDNLIKQRIVVVVDSWDRTSRYPSGHYVNAIGEIGDRATESEVSFSRSHRLLCFCAMHKIRTGGGG